MLHGKIRCVRFQALSKFESLVNQVQKNAKDINNRLVLLERTVFFKRFHAKLGCSLPGSKVRHRRVKAV